MTTLASPQLRINLSPFTKDFRVEVQYNESQDTFLNCLGSPEALNTMKVIIPSYVFFSLLWVGRGGELVYAQLGVSLTVVSLL